MSRLGRSALAWVWMAVALVVTLSWKPINIRHDSALLLECGRRIAAGEWPYRDFIEMNPPLVMYLNAVPAFAARIFDVHPIAAFNVSLILLAGLSAWRALAVASRWVAPASSGRDTRALQCVLIAAPALVVVAAQPDPGQREHLFFLLYYPFLILRAGRWGGQGTPRHAWAYGVAAAAGVALKPYFLVTVLLPELALAVRHRRWQPLVAPEAIAAVCTGAVYLLHFLFLPDAVTETFFDRIVPLVLSGYGAYNHPLPVVLDRIGWRAVVAVALLILIRRLPRPGAERLLVFPSGAFAFAALLTVVIQRKGFSYHFLPVDQILLLLVAVVAVGAVRAWAPTDRIATIAGRVAILAVVISPVIQVWRADALSAWTPLIERVSAPGDSVVVFSTSVTYAYPAILQTGRRVGSRHLSASSAIIGLEAARQGMPHAARFEALMFQELKEDVRRFRPVAILIDRQPGCHGCPPGFQLLEYFERRGVLAEMAGSYRYAGDEGGLAVYVRR